MKPMRTAAWVYAGVLGLLVLVLAWSALQLAREPARRRQWQRQEARLARLADLEQEALHLERRRVPFHEAAPAAESLAQVERLFPANEGATVQTEVEPQANWRLHRVVVVWPRTDYETLFERIRQAEALRPPLKLVACVLEAAAGRTGEGHARLEFELIDVP